VPDGTAAARFTAYAGACNQSDSRSEASLLKPCNRKIRVSLRQPTRTHGRTAWSIAVPAVGRTRPSGAPGPSYKDRNVIEPCYCRLKDFRRIATRYDKLARNYFSALCLVAAVAFWL